MSDGTVQLIEVLSIARGRTDLDCEEGRPIVVLTIRPHPDRSWQPHNLGLTIPQAERLFRLTPEMLGDFYLRNAGGEQVPLSALVDLKQGVEPSSRDQFQQLNAVIVEGVMKPGVAMGTALTYLEERAEELEGKLVGRSMPARAPMFACRRKETAMAHAMPIIATTGSTCGRSGSGSCAITRLWKQTAEQREIGTPIDFDKPRI